MPMAESLLHRAFSKKLHIALLLFFTLGMGNLNAQSLLLPGDVMFVSVNSTDDTFEFVPLINIEKGTTFYISNGEWDNRDLEFRKGSEISFEASTLIEAGTPVFVKKNEVENFAAKGDLSLSEKEEQLFLYQKETAGYRFITAIGWGNKRNRRDKSFFGSDIPEIFEENPNTFIRLENSDNYQYHLRNGASGTKRMLNQFISKPGNWRGSDDRTFPHFATSFNILNAPVILFDQALSFTEENKKKSVVNVAIYEHDGSKLTVDVVFDSLYSTISRDELNGFRSKKVNFTGLIGDAVYEVEIPLIDDEVYEGSETAIFHLENITKGKAGDFISHTLLVAEDEIPEIKLEVVSVSESTVILVHNLERSTINLRDWELHKGDYKFIFPSGSQLQVGETLLLVPSDYKFAKTQNVITIDEEFSSVFDKEGDFQLRNEQGKRISQVTFAEEKQNSTKRIAGVSENELPDNLVQENTLSSTLHNSDNTNSFIPGWKAVSQNDLKGFDPGEIELFSWDKESGSFKLSTASSQDHQNLLVGFFDSASLERLNDIQKSKSVETDPESLKLNLQSSDINNDGLINGNEGFSLVRNNSDRVLLPDLISEKLKSELELNQEVQLFKSSQDFSSIRPIEENSMIPPGNVFWIKLNEVFSSKDVILNVKELTVTQDLQIEGVATELLSLLTFAVIGNSMEAQFDVSFNSEKKNSLHTENPGAIRNLYLSDFKGMVFTSQISSKYYSNFIIDTESPNTTNLPIIFGAESNGEYELKVQNWKNIPEDFVIQIEDKKGGEIYTLNENWSLKFNYFGATENNSREIFFPEIDERFVVKVVHISQLDVEDELPQVIELNQNYPNPFNPATSISFFIPDENEVKLSVFNIVGQPVAVLFEGTKSAGEHIIEWDASDMPSGMYIYQLEVGTKIMTRKMTLVK